MVDPVQDVGEAEHDEAQEGLVPAGVEPDAPGIPRVLVDPLGALGRDEAQHCGGANPKVCPSGVDREARIGGLDWGLEHHVEHGLLEDEVDAGAERRGADVGERTVVVGEGGVGGQRDARRGDGGCGQQR